MPDLMLFPPSWHSGPPDPPEQVEDDAPTEVLCKHHEGPDCFACHVERRPY